MASVAVALQVEVRDDLGLQHRDHVGGARDAGAGPDLLGHAGAAEDLAALEVDHPQPGPGEVGAGVRPLWPPPTTIAS